MKIGSVDSCPKMLKRVLKRQQAEIEFLKDFMKSFETMRPHRRLPSGEEKLRLLNFLAKNFNLPMERKLQLISVSKSRYYQWRRIRIECLNDKSSCPKKRPMQLTFNEIEEIRRLVSDPDLDDMSLSSLYWIGRRKGMLHFSLTTWFKYIRRYNMLDSIPPRRWSRPGKKGMRAIFANQIWHLDTTILKLEDRTRVYLQAIIDNYSRYIVAWKVTLRNRGAEIKELIESALMKAQLRKKCRLISDAGVENLNHIVRETIHSSCITHEIASVDIDYSNSMIEAFFRSLKQYSLYKKIFLSFEEVKMAINDYLERYNSFIPRHGLSGLTPNEKYQNQTPPEQIGTGLDFMKKRIQLNKERCRTACYLKSSS